jgi:predicted alpha/beta hydrolase family esterase
MMAQPATVLIVPGIDDSGPSHWQSAWQARLPRAARVAQEDWAHPHLADWVLGLDAALLPLQGPVVLAAHSLGCLTVAAWAARHAQAPVAAAFLVAPPDPAGPQFPPLARGFGEPSGPALPFPSLVVASQDDPFASPAFSQRAALAWGAGFHLAGSLGHINAASNIGAWEQGLGLFLSFCQEQGLQAD